MRKAGMAWILAMLGASAVVAVRCATSPSPEPATAPASQEPAAEPSGPPLRGDRGADALRGFDEATPRTEAERLFQHPEGYPKAWLAPDETVDVLDVLDDR